MAGPRGRGFSTGKALQILFRIIADGSQARRETLKTVEDVRKAGGEIRAVETLLQRALSVLSRPVRSRLGLAGAMGISFAREQLRGLAANEIQKVKKAFGEAGDEAEKTGKKARTAGSSLAGAASSIVSARVALSAIRDAGAARAIQEVAQKYNDTSFAIKAFDEVVTRSLGNTKKSVFGLNVASGQQLKNLLNTLGVTGDRPFGKTGFTLRGKDAQEGLAQLQEGFNKLKDPVQRAAVAADLFGEKSARMLVILESNRAEFLKVSKDMEAFRAEAAKLAAIEVARAQAEEASLKLTKLQTQATELQTKAERALEATRVAGIRTRVPPVQTGREGFGRQLFGPQQTPIAQESVLNMVAAEKFLVELQGKSLQLTKETAQAREEVKTIEEEIGQLTQKRFEAITKERITAGEVESLERKRLGAAQKAAEVESARRDDIDRNTELANIASGRGASKAFLKQEAADEKILANAKQLETDTNEALSRSLQAIAERREIDDALTAKKIERTEAEIFAEKKARIEDKAFMEMSEHREAVRQQQIAGSITQEALDKNALVAEEALTAAAEGRVAVQEQELVVQAANAELDMVTTANLGLVTDGTIAATAATEALTAAELEATVATVSLQAALGGIIAVVAAAAAGGAVLVGVLFLIAKRMAETDAAMARVAEKTGISVEHVSALDIAAKKAGLGGLKTIQERLGSFDRILGQVARGELPETAFLLRKLGIDAENTGITTDEAFVKIVNAYNSAVDPADKATIASRLFADRTGKLGLTLQEIGPRMEEFTEQIRKQGLLLTEDGAKAALSFDRSLSVLLERIQAMGVQFSRPLVQPFSEGLSALTIQLGETISLAEFLGNLVALKIKEATDALILFTAFIKVFADKGFFKTMTMDIRDFNREWGKNVIAIRNGNTDIKKSEEEIQFEIEETLKKEEQRTRTKIRQIELIRDASNKAQDSITAHYKQQVERREMSRDEARKGEIDALNASLATDVAAQAELLRLAASRTATNPQEQADKATELATLTAKSIQLQTDFNARMEEIETERIVHEREQMEQWHDESIAIEKSRADARIDILEAAADRDSNLRKESITEITRINKEITDLEIEELNRRYKLAKKDTDLQRQLHSQLVLKRLEVRRFEAKQLRDIDTAEFEVRISQIKLQASRLQNIEQVNQTRIAAMRDAATRRRSIAGERAGGRAALKDVQEAIKEAGIFRDLAIQTGFKVGVANKFVQDYGDALVDLTKKTRIYNEVRQQEDTLPITLSEVTIELKEITKQGFKDRVAIKQEEINEGKKHNRNVEALEIEKQNIINAGNDAIAEIDRQYLQDLINQREQTRQILADTNNIFRDARQTQIQTDISLVARVRATYILTTEQRVKANQLQTKLTRESLDIDHAANMERLKNDQEAALSSALTDDEFLEKEESFHALREAELRRHNAEILNLTSDSQMEERRIRLEGGSFEAGLSGGDPFGGFLDRQHESLIKTGKAALSMGDMVKLGMGIAGQAVGQMAEATGSLIENWVLMGTTGPAAMRKMTASILASLAKQAAIEAIMEVARGFANLAKAAAAAPTNPVAAAAYAAAADANFIAAAVFGSVAGVAAVTGRAVAGNLFAQESATKAATEAKEKEKETEKINEGRRQFVEHIHRVVVTGEKGFVARQFVDEIKNNNQEVRRAINTAGK